MSNRQPRETFVVTLRPLPGVDGVRALKAGLKALLRRYGLRAVEVREEGETSSTGEAADA